MADIDETLRSDLQKPEFSEGYAESFLDTYIATQIKVLREQHDWTQKELANRMHTSQGVISRNENGDYAAWNINTLKKLARTFEVRLHVSFETYGSLIGDVKRFSRKTLERTPRSKDPVLLRTSKAAPTIPPSSAYQRLLFDPPAIDASPKIEDGQRQSERGANVYDFMKPLAEKMGRNNAIEPPPLKGANDLLRKVGGAE